MRFLARFFLMLVVAHGAFGQTAEKDAAAQRMTTDAGAAVISDQQRARTPDFLEHAVDQILVLFDVRETGNTVVHYSIAALFLVLAVLLRRVVTGILFSGLRKAAARTRTTLDDRLLPALESPVATLIMLGGIVASLKVLKLDLPQDEAVRTATTVATSIVIFWGLLRGFAALLDHLQGVANSRHLGIAAFMPWIKKTLLAIFVVFGVLMVVQSLGYDVKALLATLGIGGLAFALAAQDTIANVFGSIVIAIDQPFKLGETVQIGSNTGTVEDIGLRSTRIRLVDKSLAILPNKMVAAEPVVNLSRFTQRRAEFVLGLTYDTTPQQMQDVVAAIKTTILAEKEVDPTSVQVFFRDYSTSSLDLWLTFATNSPDNMVHLEARQRINLAIMRIVAERGLAFAFPTQTLHVVPEVRSKK